MVHGAGPPRRFSAPDRSTRWRSTWFRSSSEAAGGPFDHLGNDHIELDLVRRLDDRDITHLRFRVRRPEADFS
jgi:hypothetical protein